MTLDPNNLTDAPGQLWAPLLPPNKPERRPRSQLLQPLVKSSLDVTTTDVAWRFLPHEFPNYNTVFDYFARSPKRGGPSANSGTITW